MLEFTHKDLLTDVPTAGVTPRLSSLVGRCVEITRQCLAAVAEFCDDCEDYFDDGLHFAIVESSGDLANGRALARFLETEDGDVLAAVIDRMEHCLRQPDADYFELLLSISDTSATYVLIPAEVLPEEWAHALAPHASNEAAVYERVTA